MVLKRSCQASVVLLSKDQQNRESLNQSTACTLFDRHRCRVRTEFRSQLKLAWNCSMVEAIRVYRGYLQNLRLRNVLYDDCYFDNTVLLHLLIMIWGNCSDQ